MSMWELPTSLEVGGEQYAIRSDYRAVLDILTAFADPEYTDEERWYICLDILYEHADDIPTECLQEAAEKAVAFIDMRDPSQKSKDEGGGPKGVMDWEQDAGLYIPAINKVLGYEIRSVEYLHWWTFLGAYMSIGESLFSSVVSIRSKRARGEKLDKWEERFWLENKSICTLKKRLTKKEQEMEDFFKWYVDH